MPLDTSDAAASSATPDEVAREQAYLLLARNLWRHKRSLMGLWPVPQKIGLGEVSVSLGRALASLGVGTAVIVPRMQWGEASSGRAPAIRALGDGVDSLTPSWEDRTSYANVVEKTLDRTRGRYGCILCDMSGLSRIEAHEVALLPDMSIVIFVARGRIGELALARAQREISQRSLMGAVLMDGTPPQLDTSM